MKAKSYSFIVIGFVFIQLLSFQLIAQVQADFIPLTSSGCSPLTIPFTNTSTGGPTGYTWNFGNGSTSTLKDPSATFINNGNTTITFTVTLFAFNSSSNDTKTGTVTVFPKPTADFGVSLTSTCVGQPVNFMDSSIAPTGTTITSWQWDFGDGLQSSLQNPTHAYTSAGTFPVSLLVTSSNGCTHSTILNITVLLRPVAAFTASPLNSCSAPVTVNFNNNSTTSGGTTFLWDFGDNTTSTAVNPSHTYTSLGVYTVTLIVTQGPCIDTIVMTDYITVQSYAVDFTASDTVICLGDSVQFSEITVPLSTSRTWNFGNPASGANNTSTALSPWHEFTAAGTYTISVNAKNAANCPDTETKIAYITVYKNPVADFSSINKKSCSTPLTVNYTNGSTISAGNGSIVSYLWNFGDPSSGTNDSSTLQNPSHTFNNFGSYTNVLIVSTDKGCVDTIVKNGFALLQRPTANFGADTLQGCAPFSSNFTDVSTCSTDAIVAWQWDFGDPAGFGVSDPDTSTLQNPSWTYTNAPLFYDIQLIVTTQTGCKDTIVRSGYIKTGIKPLADFSLAQDSMCFGSMYTFNDLSTGVGAPDSSYWDFGDGSDPEPYNPIVPQVTHRMDEAGLSTVTLIVTNNGCPDDTARTDLVFVRPPKADIDFEGSDPLDWPCRDYGDDPYTIQFENISGNFGVGAWPLFDYDSFRWDFGDPASGVNDTTTVVVDPTHTYTSRGLKTIKLFVSNSTYGCEDSTTVSLTITDPIADFIVTPNPSCYTSVVSYTNVSQDSATGGSFWEDLPTHNDTTLTNPLNDTIDESGDYDVTLTVTDIHGCTDDTTIAVKIRGAVPDFTSNVSGGCTPLNVTFTDVSVPDGFAPITQWQWSFPGGTPSSFNGQSPPIIVYNTPGVYSVTLTVTSGVLLQCTDSVTKTIEPTFPVPLFTSDTLGCKMDPITFNASATNVAGPATYTWDFGDTSAVVSGAASTVNHAYAIDSLYVVTLIVTDKNGCVDSVKDSILIQKPVASYTNTIISEGCGFTNVQFTDASVGVSITKWDWDFGDQATSTQQNPLHSYTVAGVYTVTLIVTNSAGCKDTISFSDIVVVAGPVGTFTFTPTSGCNPLTVDFCASSDNSTSYIWDFGDGTVLKSEDSCITYTYNSSQDITYTPILIMENILTNGTPCQIPATTAGQVSIMTWQDVDITEGTVGLEEGDSLVLHSTVDSVSGIPIYSWTPSDGISCDNCPETMVIGNGSGLTSTYILMINDTGCVSYDTAYIIHLVCEADLFMIPNVFTPNDDDINDVFLVDKGFCAKSKYQLTIYDRWGIEVFYSISKNLSWNGKTTSGTDAPEGVYYYLIKADNKTYNGFLHLIR